MAARPTSLISFTRTTCGRYRPVRSSKLMLLKNKTIEGIQSGKISLIFRRWEKAGVKKGGTQMTQLGVIGIDDVKIVTEDEITDRDAKKAGFNSRDELL